MQAGDQQQQRPVKFQLNKTDINRIGFDLTTDKKCQFLDIDYDQQKPHPLCTTIPEHFTLFDFPFQFQKICPRLPDDNFIYIFYNIIDQKLQLQAARALYNYPKIEYKKGSTITKFIKYGYAGKTTSSNILIPMSGSMLSFMNRSKMRIIIPRMTSSRNDLHQMVMIECLSMCTALVYLSPIYIYIYACVCQLCQQVKDQL